MCKCIFGLFVATVVAFLVFIPIHVESSKILMVFPSPSRSHLVIGSALMKGLAEHGHNVTVVSSFPLEKPMKNYRDIVVPLQNVHNTILANFVDEKSAGPHKMLFIFPTMVQIGLNASNNSLHLPEFQKIMAEEEFDLVINGMFLSDFMIGLGAHFNCPVVVLSTVQTLKVTNDLVGNPTAASTTRHMLMKDLGGQMTFMGRVKNMLLIIIEFLITKYQNYRHEEYYNINFPPGKYPTYQQMRENISLVLIGHHFSLGHARPYVPNMVEVGGLQIKSKADPLPDDLQQFIDEAEEGVIFVSFGSNFRSTDLPEAKRNILLSVFGKLKQRVLWKWEDDSLPGKPSNVMIKKWTPQTDILAHPNIKLFVTHGGLGSVTESKFRGVPILGIPLFGDQFTNTQTAVNEGWAIYVDYLTLSEESLTSTINEVLTNPAYKNNAKHFANLFQDRPKSALDTAIYWIEYVIRHKGASHLRASAVHLNFMQYHSYDVIAFLLLVSYLVIKLSCLALKCLCCMIFRKFCKNCKCKKSNNKNKKD